MALGEIVDIFDHRRVPLSSRQRSSRQGPYPYYGAQGVIDHIDEYTFDGRFILVPEDGENLRSRKLPVAYFAEGKFWVNNHAHVIRARPNLAVDRFVQSAIEATNIDAWITGAAQPKLSQANLRQIPLKVPPLREQLAIASILDAFDDLFENNRRRFEILEEMARTVYHDWFVKFLYPGHDRAPLIDSALGPIPNDWSVTTIGNVCSRVQAGATPRRAEASFWAEPEFDWYKTGDLTDSVLVRSSEQISQIAFDGGRTFDPETILLAIYGSPTVGRLGLLTSPSSANQAALGLVADPALVSTEFLWFTLCALRGHLNQIAQGAAQQNVSKEKVCRSTFVLPDRATVEAFTRSAGQLWRQANAIARLSVSLSGLRDLLLPKLVTGQIDVCKLDLAAVIEEAVA